MFKLDHTFTISCHENGEICLSVLCLCSLKGREGNVSVCGQQMIIAVNWQELQVVCGLICCDLHSHSPTPSPIL